MDRVQQLADLLQSMTAVDLAPRLERGMPRYPAHPHLIIDPTVTHERHGYYCQSLSMPEHIGCHVNAPAHTVPKLMDSTVDTLPVDQLVGPAVVYDFSQRDLQPGQTLTADDFLEYERDHGVQAGAGDMPLVCFGWHRRHWSSPAFYERNQPGNGRKSDGAVRRAAKSAQWEPTRSPARFRSSKAWRATRPATASIGCPTAS